MTITKLEYSHCLHNKNNNNISINNKIIYKKPYYKTLS